MIAPATPISTRLLPRARGHSRGSTPTRSRQSDIALLGRKSGVLTPRSRRVAIAARSSERKRYGAAVNRLKARFEAAFAARGGGARRRAAKAASAPASTSPCPRAAAGSGRASGHAGRRRDRRDLPRARIHGRRRPRGRDRVVQLPRAQLPARPSGDGHARHALSRCAAAEEPAGAAAPHPHLAGADPDDAGVAAADPGGDPRASSTAATPSTRRTRRCSRRSKGSRWTRGSPSSTSRRR